MIHLNLGRIGFIFQGLWNDARAYVPLDLVRHRNSLWLAVAPNVGETPSRLSASWILAVEGTEYPAEPLHLWVRPDGSDTANDGTSDSAAGAFATPQRAVDEASRRYSLGGQALTIHLAGGPFPGWSQGSGLNACGASRITFQGEGDAVVDSGLDPARTAVAVSSCSVPTYLDDLTIRCAASAPESACCYAGPGTNLRVKNFAVTGSAASRNVFQAWGGGYLVVFGTVSVTGDYKALFQANDAGIIRADPGANFVLNDVSMANCVAYATAQGCVRLENTVFEQSGTVTGARYKVDKNALIATGGKGESFVPGSLPGTAAAATGGVYE